jgi:hypothetical protein
MIFSMLLSRLGYLYASRLVPFQPHIFAPSHSRGALIHTHTQAAMRAYLPERWRQIGRNEFESAPGAGRALLLALGFEIRHVRMVVVCNT